VVTANPEVHALLEARVLFDAHLSVRDDVVAQVPSIGCDLTTCASADACAY